RLQSLIPRGSTRCEEYVWTVAPFALQALYAQELVSVNQVEVAKHIFKHMLYAVRHKFRWMTNSSRKYAIERFRSLLPIIGIPDDLYSPLAMDKQYSYLPKFKAPFISSILDAFEARANHDLFNFMMTRFGKFAVESRWKSLYLLETAETRGLDISANAFYTPYYMMMFIPTPMLAMPFLDVDMPATSYGSLGSTIGHEAMHAFDRLHVDQKVDGTRGDWGYDFNGSYSQRVNCIIRLYDRRIMQRGKNYTATTLYENMADIAGMELTIAAMQNDSCYRPDFPSILLPGMTQQQLFFIANCHQYCSATAVLRAYRVSPHPRDDHRCNVVLNMLPEFREAFGCPAPQTEQCHILT
ncbi:unnamed protein product, partial [Ixodes hexagonus]